MPTNAKTDLDFVRGKKASTRSVCTLSRRDCRHVIMANMALELRNHTQQLQNERAIWAN